jgi:hypothetical protein
MGEIPTCAGMTITDNKKSPAFFNSPPTPLLMLREGSVTMLYICGNEKPKKDNRTCKGDAEKANSGRGYSMARIEA